MVLDEPEVRLFVEIVVSAFTMASGLFTLAWWLGKQFEFNRKVSYTLISELKESVETKLDRHEDKDVERFREVNDRIWEIQIRNAGVDRTPPPPPPR
jgi:hypothetical protein